MDTVTLGPLPQILPRTSVRVNQKKDPRRESVYGVLCDEMIVCVQGGGRDYSVLTFNNDKDEQR